mmetsp:Transcript_15147/g.32680  ORF Transcript_15147/g.32680 Transcript_15147/m.32680 type:complete len:270 (-) Transcript_15147:34-843(-)
MAGGQIVNAGLALDEDVADGMLLDPPDPLDLLIAHTESGVLAKSRPLDFVRAKFSEMKQENRQLKQRVADLEQTLTIVQTAQEWAAGRGMTAEQQDRMKEVRALLEQAKKAREEIQTFSGASRQSLFEKLRDTKAALKREKQEKQEMKDRLVLAFDHARNLKEQNRQLQQQQTVEQEKWQNLVRDMKDRHRLELQRLRGDGAVAEADRQDQYSFFGEQVCEGLLALQQHLRSLRQETVDAVIMEGGEARPLSGGSPVGGFGGPVEDEDF